MWVVKWEAKGVPSKKRGGAAGKWGKPRGPNTGHVQVAYLCVRAAVWHKFREAKERGCRMHICKHKAAGERGCRIHPSMSMSARRPGKEDTGCVNVCVQAHRDRGKRVWNVCMCVCICMSTEVGGEKEGGCWWVQMVEGGRRTQCRQAKKGSRGDLSERLMIFPAGFPIGFAYWQRSLATVNM